MVKIYKCPNCSGDLQFSPEKQMFLCSYCISEFSEKEILDLAGENNSDDIIKYINNINHILNEGELAKYARNNNIDPYDAISYDFNQDIQNAINNTNKDESSALPTYNFPVISSEILQYKNSINKLSEYETKDVIEKLNNYSLYKVAKYFEDLEVEKEKQQEELEATAIYICPSCGAEVVTDSTTAATKCYYCKNPVVFSGKLSGKFYPDRVIPFKLSKNEAIDDFKKWAKKKYFLPKDFISESSLESFTGIYYPYWIIDCDTVSSVNADATKMVSWTNGDTRYTEISTYSVKRSGNVHLEDVIKVALNKANKKLVEGVQPYDAKDFIKFRMPYLSGFLAEKRDIEKTEMKTQTDQDIQNYCNQIMRDTIKGYTTVNVLSSTNNVVNETWEYSLLPVWTLTYPYKDNMYYYAMNGQTSKVCGCVPVDKEKLFKVSSILAGIALIISLIGGYFIS